MLQNYALFIKKFGIGNIFFRTGLNFLNPFWGWGGEGRGRGTPTLGSWPGVGGGDYSDVGVRNKWLDCAKDFHKKGHIYSTKLYAFVLNLIKWMKKINEDDSKTKANTISAQTLLPTLKISELGDFENVFLYFSWLQSSWMSTIFKSGEFKRGIWL